MIESVMHMNIPNHSRRRYGSLRLLAASVCLAVFSAHAQLPDEVRAPLGPPPDASVRGTMPAQLEEIDVKLASRTPTLLRLERDDYIKLIVLGYPDLTHVGKVQRDGRVTLPGVGDIPAEGKTLREVREEVRKLLGSSGDSTAPGIAVDDVLRMTVWRHPDLDAKVPVAADGTVTLPLVGDIEAVGKSLADIRETARQKLSVHLRDPKVSILIDKQVRRGLIVDPQVWILPERMRERKAVVIGEVMIQGPQIIGEHSRVMDVLGGARPNMQRAQLNDVVLIRDVNGKVPQYTKLLISDFLDGKAPDQNIYLAPDDVIVVPRTLLTSIGDFIESFFVRTKPIFDWWNAMYVARYADQYNRGLLRIYDSIQN